MESIEVGTTLYRIDRYPGLKHPLVESGVVTKATQKLLRVKWGKESYDWQEHKERLGKSLFMSESEALQTYLERHDKSIERIIASHHEALALRDRITKQLEALKETQGC